MLSRQRRNFFIFCPVSFFLSSKVTSSSRQGAVGAIFDHGAAPDRVLVRLGLRDLHSAFFRPDMSMRMGQAVEPEVRQTPSPDQPLTLLRARKRQPHCSSGIL